MKRQKNRNPIPLPVVVPQTLSQLHDIQIPENLFSLSQVLLNQNNMQRQNARPESPMTIADIMGEENYV